MTIVLAEPLASSQPRRRQSHLAAVAVALVAVTFAGSTLLWNSAHYWVMHVIAVQTMIYALAAWMVSKRGSGAIPATRGILVMVLAAAAVMRLAIVAAPPVSTDIYRYIWDGRTQSNGINPYKYIPYEVALYPQRDPEIYTKINRYNWLKTPYPPTAQWVFFLTSRLGGTVLIAKLVMLLFECATVWGLLILLRSRNIPASRVLLYAWNPLVIWEIGGSGHTEAIGIAFMVLAMVAADAGKLFLSGLALGAGALSKFFPLASAPAIYQRWDWRMPAGMIVATLALSAPYLGELGGMLESIFAYYKEVGADTGKAFFLLSWIDEAVALPAVAAKAYLPVCGLFLLLAGVVVAMRKDRRRSAPVAALWLVTALQVVLSPHYPWYLTWAVPFLCFRISSAVIWLTCSASLLYEFFTPLGPSLYAIIWGPFLVLAAAEIVLDRLRRVGKPPQAAVATA